MDIVQEILTTYDFFPYIKLIIGGFFISRLFKLVFFLSETKTDIPRQLKNKSVITQYDPPVGLSPIEVGTIINRQVDGNDISANIMNLVVLGYIKIDYSTDFTDLIFTKIKDSKDLIDPADQEVFKLLFVYGNTINLHTLKNLGQSLTSSINIIIERTEDYLCSKGYLYSYAKSRFKKSFEVPLMIVSVASFFATFFSAFFILFTPEKLTDLLVYHRGYLIFIISVIIFIGTSHVYRRMKNVLTKKGIETYAHILGFKVFLEKTEKDRLDFFNSPGNKPEVIEKFLPYAMVLHVENKWSKLFEGLYKAKDVD